MKDPTLMAHIYICVECNEGAAMVLIAKKVTEARRASIGSKKLRIILSRAVKAGICPPGACDKSGGAIKQFLCMGYQLAL